MVGARAAVHTIAPSAGAKFRVELVPHDAREEESLHSALESLVQRSDVANTIFNSITDRYAQGGGGGVSVRDSCVCVDRLESARSCVRA